MRVYIDTSVVGGCFDDEFSQESLMLFEMAKLGELVLLISNILADELLLAPEQVQRIITELPQKSFEIINESDESRKLRDKYLESEIVGSKHFNDAHHVAIATVSEATMIVSWNFKHIVHYDKIRSFNKVNISCGYNEIQIYCPLEVI